MYVRDSFALLGKLLRATTTLWAQVTHKMFPTTAVQNILYDECVMKRVVVFQHIFRLNESI